MATVDKYLWFDINLTDKAQVATLQAAHPAGIFISPNAAAAAYAVGGVPLGVQLTTDPVVNPGIRSAYFIPNSDFPRDVQEFNKKSGGWFGLSFLFGNNTRYHWVGFFKYPGSLTGEIDGVPTEVVAIAQRRFIIGFEMFGMEILSMGADERAITRDASRHVDGMGWKAWSSNAELTANANQLGGGAVTKGWDRVYVQLEHVPTATQRFWRVKLSGGASRGASLNWTPDRRIVCHNIGDAGTETAIATTTMQFEIGRWYRLDILHEAANPGGRLRLWVAKELVLTANAPAGTGLGAGSNWESSKLGGGTTAAITNFDDWIGADWPTPDSNGRFTGLDWLNGSRVVRPPVTGFATGNAWLGDARYLNQFNTTIATLNAKATSIVSGDALRVVVDTPRIKAVPGSLGAVAFTVGYHGQQTVGGQGTLGWKFDGLIDLAAQTTESTAIHSDRRMYRPLGLLAPIEDLTPLELHKIKAANTDLVNCWSFGVSIELIGIFGDEDVAADEDDQPTALTPPRGEHNAPYPETPWARTSLAQSSPVVTHSGTYVGNDTVTELLFRAPVHWLVVTRTVASGQTGGFWFSPMYSAHEEGIRQDNAGDVVEVRIDPTFVLAGVVDQQEQRTRITIVGNSAQFNASGVTYQYIAFEDPGSRYCLNGGYAADPAAFVAGFPVPLPHSTFLPIYVFFHGIAYGQVNSSYDRYIKGPGHAAPNASIMNAAETANGATIAAGLITALSTQITTGDISRVFSAWRQDDQSSDPNKLNVVRIGTYIGDGAASRTINFGTSGKRPLYAIVTPHNGTSYHRSPFNLTNTSNTMSNGSSATTAITAGGIDSITVGTLLNTNLIVYEYFILIGSATAGNGGWSIDGEFSVVEPDSPADGDYDDPAEIDEPDPDPVDPDPDPGPSDEDDCLAGEICVLATTREVNRALLEIGNTKFLTNYCTQNTLEAQTARLLYESSVRAVLHAFPWPFATKYAVLALAATQPNNQDWAFAYRQPVDCIFERRISVARLTGVDPTPPPFELSSDSSGGLIFTNEPAAVLEYTCRPACVAFAGDALFREALVWHLAAKLAPPLTRMADKAKFCMDEYDKSIAKANAIIRPDDPGLRITPTWQAQDVGANAMAANVEVANLALLKIGAKTIASLAPDQSREGASVNLLFEHELRATLRDYPWKFAKRYNDALALIGGTATVPVNVDWQYSYRLPADYVSVRRLATEGTGRSFERHPKTFEVGGDAVGDLLFTGEDAPNIEYTARIANAVLRADHLFREALAWRLAAALAPALAAADPEVQEQPGRGPEHPPDNTQRVSLKPNKAAMRERAQRWAFGQYLRAIEKARIADANESEPEPHGEAEWIEGRN